MKFTHLHVHSHYSLLDGLSKIDELLDYTKELGMDSIALTDHGVLYGAVEFYKKAKERGIKPIIGCEMYQSYEKMEQKRPNIDNKRYHLILLVKNEEGYRNLVKLVTKAHLDGFYYKPRIDEELLEKHSKGLICLTACLAGKIPRLILSKKIEEAEKLALKYQKIFGSDSFYLEIQHHPGIPEQETVNQALITISKKYNIPLVATNDCHYLRHEDAEAQDTLMLINTGAKIEDAERVTMKTDDFSLRSPEKMIEDFKNIPEAIENTQKIVNLCNFEFKLGDIKLPYFKVPNDKSAYDYLRNLCYEGLKKRYPDGGKEVIKRLEYELSVIKQTGFISYFLIVQDFVNWAKKNRIVVGPGRGSAGGSIVSYLLNITNIDPLKYDLLFERFLNPERISMPDIDLDFTDRRRNEVINYVAQKYGRSNVAQIITFGTMAARAVIRDVGRAINYPYSYCDHMAKIIPTGFTLNQSLQKISEFKELYESDEKARRLIDLSKKLEGVVRHASTHACGVVISKESLEYSVPLQHPTQNDESIITQYEMHAIEDLGLLKMDFLGLKNLTIIEDTLNRIYAIHKKNIDIEKIPLDDKKTYKLLQRGETKGVFQLESSGMQRYLKQLKPTEFEDIIVMVALYRPGPMQFIPEYIGRKEKKRKIEYLHPKLKPILEKTQGICIFQEQLMKIAQELAGFSLSEADVLRKAVGKKIKKLLLKQKEKFIKGGIKNNINEKAMEKLWEWVLPFASYGFNRAHSTGYATISYQTAYLKSTFPLEFMSSLLTSEKNDTEGVALLIEECKKMGIEVLPPDINESFRNFTVVPGQNKIRFGLLAIKNIGSDLIDAIVEERKNNNKFKSIEDFINRMMEINLNKKFLESSIKAGIFDQMEERNMLLTNVEKILEWSRENQKAKMNGQIGLFENTKIDSSLHLSPAPRASKSEMLDWEKELLGLYISGHPLDIYKKFLEREAVSISDIKKEKLPDKEQGNPYNNWNPYNNNGFGQNQSWKKIVRVGGIISQIKRIITKNGKPMLFLKIEDLTDRIEVVVFPSITEANSLIFKEGNIIFISGKIDNRDGTKKIIAQEAEKIIEK